MPPYSPKSRHGKAILIPARGAAGTRPASTLVAARPLAGDSTVPACPRAPVGVLCPGVPQRKLGAGSSSAAKTAQVGSQ